MSKLIAITGHTSGIGLAISQRMTGLGYRVLGFSRSNGYDLSKMATLPKILLAIDDCDVFINNATFGWQQTELLYCVFDKWRQLDRFIINISSNSTDQKKSSMHPYAVFKGALDAASLQVSYTEGTRCRVTNLRPGWVNTPSVKDQKVEDSMLEASDIASMVEWTLGLPSHIQIPSLTIKARVP